MMVIDGYPAVVEYDRGTNKLHGRFVGLNGSPEFYSRDVEHLRAEGAVALRVFFDTCEEQGIEPEKQYSGRFNVRISPHLHAKVAAAAAASGKSLNQWVSDCLDAHTAESVVLAGVKSIQESPQLTLEFTEPEDYV